MSVFIGLLLVFVGAVIGWCVGYFAPGVLRRAQGKGPIDFHVEEDPSIVYAGAPPWVGAVHVFDGTLPPDGPESTVCTDWWSWANERGGVDGDRTAVVVTLVGSTS